MADERDELELPEPLGELVLESEHLTPQDRPPPSWAGEEPWLAEDNIPEQFRRPIPEPEFEETPLPRARDLPPRPQELPEPEVPPIVPPELEDIEAELRRPAPIVPEPEVDSFAAPEQPGPRQAVQQRAWQKAVQRKGRLGRKPGAALADAAPPDAMEAAEPAGQGEPAGQAENAQVFGDMLRVLEEIAGFAQEQSRKLEDLASAVEQLGEKLEGQGEVS